MNTQRHIGQNILLVKEGEDFGWDGLQSVDDRDRHRFQLLDADELDRLPQQHEQLILGQSLAHSLDLTQETFKEELVEQSSATLEGIQQLKGWVDARELLQPAPLVDGLEGLLRHDPIGSGDTMLNGVPDQLATGKGDHLTPVVCLRAD